jgi:hypothetical protein
MPPPLCLDQRVIDRRDAGTARLARRQQLEARRDAAEPNMPLKLYDTQDAVPEAQRANAIETKDGKFAVVEEDPQLADAGKRALDAERKRARDAEEARKAAEKERDDLKRARDAAAKGISEEELAEDPRRRSESTEADRGRARPARSGKPEAQARRQSPEALPGQRWHDRSRRRCDGPAAEAHGARRCGRHRVQRREGPSHRG